MTTENELIKLEKSFNDILDNGISARAMAEQIRRFETGFPSTRLERACTPGDGIYRIESDERDFLLDIYEDAAEEGRFSKFVPASGAATRMFKHLLAMLNSGNSQADLDEKDAAMCRDFMDSLPVFPFYEKLKDSMADAGFDIDECCATGDYVPVLESLLTEKGLGYGSMPKGLIPFHRYGSECRTPFEEHIAEAVEHIRCGKGRIKVHFTVSPAYSDAIKEHIEQAREKFFGHKLDISYSVQSGKTDTVAVDMENNVFRTADSKILFRPAGHGALLGNLYDMCGDIVYLKNIDNIVPDSVKGDTVEYKKLLGGLLVQLQSEVFECIKILEKPDCDELDIATVAIFAVTRLNMRLPDDYALLSIEEKIDIFYSRLARPVRVCGMVRNEGEPGGGPFWVKGVDGVAAPQIVEKSQVDLDDPLQAEVLGSATHFNPVDLVCGVRNHKGERFNLHDFVDPETGFISVKSKDGRKLKAMELPGLWNGSMADWITFFVEVPLSTFSPVKTVNDLLKDEHRQ
ncbi:DUF4301 family protein [Maridesulfovibrio sp.]|uniref:DUF4301 family protein n=1 Tax=Maridesulfovibrio sp. TaxID=2795000 RepID=UPI002A18B45C|nr:DUF4301 family protein [Maridesulfovibrio sp.]